MKFVQRKVTTAKSKHAVAEFEKLKKQFLVDVIATVEMKEIPLELIFNWDQTGIKIVPGTTWTMHQQGAKCVELSGAKDKRLITATFCGLLMGHFLPIQVIYKGKTTRCHPSFKFPLDWDVTHSLKRWSNEATMIQYIERIIMPYIEQAWTTSRARLGAKWLVEMADYFSDIPHIIINGYLPWMGLKT